MLAQVEELNGDYIAGVYFADGMGGGYWARLRNFGPRQGDAIAFREYDIPKFSDTELRAFAKTYKADMRYVRLSFRNYRIDKTSGPTGEPPAE